MWYGRYIRHGIVLGRVASWRIRRRICMRLQRFACCSNSFYYYHYYNIEWDNGIVVFYWLQFILLYIVWVVRIVVIVVVYCRARHVNIPKCCYHYNNNNSFEWRFYGKTKFSIKFYDLKINVIVVHAYRSKILLITITIFFPKM